MLFTATGRSLTTRMSRGSFWPAIGVDPSLLDDAISDPTTHNDVMVDHDRVVRGGGFGVPTLVFGDGQMLFGPVVKEPPEADRAVDLWHLTTAWLEFPHLYELQGPKSTTPKSSRSQTLCSPT